MTKRKSRSIPIPLPRKSKEQIAIEEKTCRNHQVHLCPECFDESLPDLRGIPKLLRANYRVNVAWKYLEETLEGHHRDTGIDLDPDFQRGHVWTQAQQIAYVEYILQDGPYARELQFNSAGWQEAIKCGVLELVDGKQRLTAVLRFLHNEIPAFGRKLQDYRGFLGHRGLLYPTQPDFIFFINNLRTREQVLTWYLQINAGGVVHTDEEIQKVRRLLELERSKHESPIGK